MSSHLSISHHGQCACTQKTRKSPAHLFCVFILLAFPAKDRRHFRGWGLRRRGLTHQAGQTLGWSRWSLKRMIKNGFSMSKWYFSSTKMDNECQILHVGPMAATFFRHVLLGLHTVAMWNTLKLFSNVHHIPMVFPKTTKTNSLINKKHWGRVSFINNWRVDETRLWWSLLDF